MLKLLIIDQDEDNIKNFRRYLKTSFPSIKSIYTLSDQNRDILFVLQEISPDLVIADMSFFGSGVIKTMASISDRYPEIKFIVYGTINDAAYIQKIMEFGVIDHMYRPVKPAEFKLCMERAFVYFEKYNARKKQEELTAAQYRENIAMFENKFLTSLVNGSICHEHEIRRSFTYFNLNFTGRYTVFLMRVDRFKKIILTLDETEKHMLALKITNIANQKFTHLGIKARAFIYELNCVACIVGEDKTFNDLFLLCETIKDDVYRNLKIRVTVGLGMSYKNAADIQVSFNEADAALRYRFYLGQNTVIPINFADPGNRLTYRYPVEKEKKLVYNAVCGDYAYCETLLVEITGALNKSGPLPDKLISKIAADIMLSICRYTGEQNLMPEYKLAEFFKLSDALTLKTPDDALEYLKNALAGFCGCIRDMRALNDEELLKRAKIYITDHFHESVNLIKTAFDLKTTPEHLNGLFLANGQSYYEYAGRLRLNESRRLIKETEMSDEQIALKVGYEEVRHFRGLFKQQFGVFPQDFRSAVRSRI